MNNLVTKFDKEHRHIRKLSSLETDSSQVGEDFRLHCLRLRWAVAYMPGY